MDGVIVNLDYEIQLRRKINTDYNLIDGDMIPGVFESPNPMKHAVESINALVKSEKYDVYIASTSPWGNPEAATHKIKWIQQYFPELLKKRVILTHHKYLLKGDYLIDDRKCNGDKFEGTFIHFGSEEFPDWKAICKCLQVTI